MKRAAILLLAILLIPTTPALASDDMGGMTREQLLALRSEIEAELLSRDKGRSVTVPPGEYEFGVDLPAGTYSLTLKDPSAYSATVYIHRNMADFRKGGYDRSYDLHGSRETLVGKAIFYAGEILEVRYASVVFAPYTGLKFD